MSKLKGLGRGLEALMPKSTLSSGKTIINLPIAQIKPNPYQPRIVFDDEAIRSLSDSILRHGLNQPIVVRRKEDHYELIAGERRLRACQLADLTTVPAIIKNVTDKESIQIALIENLERRDLNAIEVAKGYLRLIKEFEMTHQNLSEIFSKNRSTITNTLRLLTLPANIQKAVALGQITEGHARAILGLDSEEKMQASFEAILENKLSVRDTESAIQAKKENPKPSSRRPKQFKPLEKEIFEKYGWKAKLKGKLQEGKLEITFKSEDEFKKLTALLQLSQ